MSGTPLPPPASILKLKDDVVARIAAGEVLQRPASALKELLDNAIDAGATQITVVVGEGGAKSLQVQDDGSGVQASDLPLLCARHATSKLRCFEDLSAVGTLGFRGEALASISHVAHVTVTSMTAGHSHGTRATFRDGTLLECRPCAATIGTTILVEDLFYNLPARQKALSAGGAEYARMLHIVSQYAVVNAAVGFSIRRLGRHPDLQTNAGATELELVSKVFGVGLFSTLAPFRAFQGDQAWLQRNTIAQQDAPVFAAQGFINVRGQNARSTLVLRINGRVVQWPALKRALDATFSATHSSPSCMPFIILDMQLPSVHVDVNLHPTKEEVAVLHEDAVIDSVCSAAQDLLQQHHLSEMRAVKPHNSSGIAARCLGAARVRTDQASQTIPSLACAPVQNLGSDASASGPRPDRQHAMCLTSIAADANEGLANIVKRHVHIGISGHWWVLQHGADLYLLDLRIAAEDMAYQQALLHAGVLPRIRLTARPLIRSALSAAVIGGSHCAGSQDVQVASDTLLRHAALLRDDFGVDISERGHLCALPDLLCGVLPDPQRLPEFLLQLSASFADCKTQPCLGIAQALSRLYNVSHADSVVLQGLVRLAQRAWTPSKARASDKSLVRVTSLHKLYKIFERC